MTRLPWQHARNRTKSGSEKSNLGLPQDWFSRTTVEPSRQALADLVKAHNRMGSDESGPKGLRSRTNTINSQRSHKTHSRSGTPDHTTWSRPSSQGTGEGPISPSASTSRSGRLLKRPSSRMSLSSAGSSSANALSSPLQPSRVSSSTVRADEIRSKISAPFDFQHITHTEETQFAGLRRIEETALAHQYIAATSVQRPAPALRGIATSDLPSAVSAQQSHTPSSPRVSVDAPSVAMSELPQTPPRPLPPPKDDVVVDKHFLDLHTSTENEPLETTGLAWLSAYPEYAPANNADSQQSAVETHLKLKPLPELPVIHAISTEDETAMAMISSPLPTPPVRDSTLQDNFFPSRPHHYRQQSSLNSSYRSLYPSTKSSMPNLLAVNHTLAAPRMLSRHHSDMALSQQAKSFSSTVSTRTSMSFAAIDTMNWEDAVDEAWDFPEGVDDDNNNTSFSSFYSDKSRADTNFLDVPALDSAGSTPLMMTGPVGIPRSPDRASFSHGMETHVLESVKEDEPSTDIAGLGISACPAAGTTPTVPRLSRSSSGHLPRRRSSLGHHANDVLTRSSSQESIILSIASSIIGTQRSSNSSVSAVDLTGACSGQARDSTNFTFNHSGDGECREGSIGVARPESGCLPPDILDQLSHFGTGFSTDEESTTEDVSVLPPLPGQILRRSAPKLSVPERRSSIVVTMVPGEPRKRSSTWANRSRQVPHGSYSLFPTARQSSCMAVPSA